MKNVSFRSVKFMASPKISPFWRRVRELRHIIAVQLYMKDHRHLDVFITPEIKELKEGGYWDRARVLALRRVGMEEPSLKTRKQIRTEE